MLNICKVVVWFVLFKGPSIPDCTAYTMLFSVCVCVCVVLGMNQFWSEGVTQLEVHWDVMFGAKS